MWLGQLADVSAADERAALKELEGLGYGAFWFGEAAQTREAFTHAATLLSWTERAVVATGIASIYARDATAMANGARALADAYPSRFILGLGVSHAPMVAERGHSYGRPIEAMTTYLDAMDACPYNPPAPSTSATIVLAALRPRMLELAAGRSNGAHPYFTTPAHTTQARRILGPDRLLAPEQAVVLETDAREARRLARLHVSHRLGMENYRRHILGLGFTERDLQDGGSDELVDSFVAWGSVDDIRDRVRQHLEAGADHVPVQVIGPQPLQAFRELAEPLLSL